jgi:transposase
MNRFGLEIRPIYYQKEDALRSHVRICFVGLIIEKYLELSTKMSLTNKRLLVWSIIESNIRNAIPRVTFKYTSSTSEI